MHCRSALAAGELERPGSSFQRRAVAGFARRRGGGRRRGRRVVVVCRSWWGSCRCRRLRRRFRIWCSPRWPVVEEGRAFELVGPWLFELAVAFPAVCGEVGLTGTPGEQAGAVPVHAMFAFVPVLSANTTSPPAAIVTLLAGVGFAPEPGVAQHGQCALDAVFVDFELRFGRSGGERGQHGHRRSRPAQRGRGAKVCVVEARRVEKRARSHRRARLRVRVSAAPCLGVSTIFTVSASL